MKALLDSRERRNGMLLFFMVVVMGILETVGVASVMPFMTVLSNAEVIHTSDYLSALYDALGFTDTHEFLVFLGTVTFLLVVGSLIFKAVTHWAMARYVQMRKYTISARLLRNYLNRPYSFFIDRHSAELGKKILSEVAQVVSLCLKPSVELVANSVVMIFLITLIVAINPVVAVIAVAVLGSAYVVVYTVFRKYLRWIGAERVEANKQRFQIAQEALSGIKDVKVLGLENGYIQSFRKPANEFARSTAKAQVIGEIPRFVLQALVYGGMLVIVLSILATDGNDLSAVLPLVTVYAFAASRLIPAIQNVYKAITSLRFGEPSLDILYADTVDEQATEAPAGCVKRVDKDKCTAPMALKNRLELNNVSFKYPFASKTSIKDVTLTINARTTVGFIGVTGAGKTTIVDIILGLLEPQQGEMRVDGELLSQENISAWQENIGYVPQHIFLSDDTVAANIAFGVTREDVDYDAVERAAKTAELHRFVTEEMPDGYATMVGDRGIRLSGGQRQRIGIARALYRNPDVLVLDEATSALDTITESAVMHAMHNLGNRKTVIIVAHRLSTVRDCHNIFVLENGSVADSGTYGCLLDSNPHFEAMAAR